VAAPVSAQGSGAAAHQAANRSSAVPLGRKATRRAGPAAGSASLLRAAGFAAIVQRD
jgi:hypothetical protein